jgi:hypothetical protein
MSGFEVVYAEDMSIVRSEYDDLASLCEFYSLDCGAVDHVLVSGRVARFNFFGIPFVVRRISTVDAYVGLF